MAAPGFAHEAVEALKSKQRLRLVRLEVQWLTSPDPPRGAVLASDGFFPCAGSIEYAAGAGNCAFVQPGGLLRDAEVIAACDERDLTMVFTDRRVFRH